MGLNERALTTMMSNDCNPLNWPTLSWLVSVCLSVCVRVSVFLCVSEAVKYGLSGWWRPLSSSLSHASSSSSSSQWRIAQLNRVPSHRLPCISPTHQTTQPAPRPTSLSIDRHTDSPSRNRCQIERESARCPSSLCTSPATTSPAPSEFYSPLKSAVQCDIPAVTFYSTKIWTKIFT